MKFDSCTNKIISDHKQFEAPNETNQDLQIHPQHQNLAPVEGTNWTSQNYPKQPKTTTPKRHKDKSKLLKDMALIYCLMHYK